MEINDALVEAITKELLRRLQGGGGVSGNGKAPLVLAGGKSKLSPGTLAALEERFGIIEHDKLEASFPEDAAVLVTGLSIQALTRVAEGDAGCTPEGHALIWALLRGKAPVVLEEGIAWRAFKGTMKSALAEQYCAHERTLARYGVKIVQEPCVCEALAGKKVPLPSVSVDKVSSTPAPRAASGPKGKRVVSETDLIRACPEAKGYGQVFAMGPKDILTPLARDYAAKMQISIERT